MPELGFRGAHAAQDTGAASRLPPRPSPQGAWQRTPALNGLSRRSAYPAPRAALAAGKLIRPGCRLAVAGSRSLGRAFGFG